MPGCGGPELYSRLKLRRVAGVLYSPANEQSSVQKAGIDSRLPFVNLLPRRSSSATCASARSMSGRQRASRSRDLGRHRGPARADRSRLEPRSSATPTAAPACLYRRARLIGATTCAGTSRLTAARSGTPLVVGRMARQARDALDPGGEGVDGIRESIVAAGGDSRRQRGGLPGTALPPFTRDPRVYRVPSHRTIWMWICAVTTTGSVVEADNISSALAARRPRLRARSDIAQAKEVGRFARSAIGRSIIDDAEVFSRARPRGRSPHQSHGLHRCRGRSRALGRTGDTCLPIGRGALRLVIADVHAGDLSTSRTKSDKSGAEG